MTDRKVLSFASEKEEATWLDANREERDEQFVRAIEEGRTRKGNALQRAADSRVIALDPEDEEKARQIASNRGLDYKAYVKSLVHEALAHEALS